MTIRLILLTFIVTAIHISSFAQSWEKIADCDDHRRMYAIAFSWNGKGYMGLGHNLNSAACFKDIEAYDPGANAWTQEVYLDVVGRTGAFSFCYKNLLFFGGGSADSGKSSLRDFYCYHLGEQESISSYLRKCDTLDAIPFAAAFGAGAVLIDSIAYVAGGCIHDTCEAYLWAYNLTTNKWKQLSPLPMKSQFGCSFALGGKLYYGGGNDNSGFASRDFWQYDPSTDKWEKRKRLPGIERTMGISLATSNTEGIFGLGFDVNSYLSQLANTQKFGLGYAYRHYPVISSQEKHLLRDIWKYDSINDSWKRIKKFPDARRNACAFALDGYLYILTGKSFESNGSYRIKI